MHPLIGKICRLFRHGNTALPEFKLCKVVDVRESTICLEPFLEDRLKAGNVAAAFGDAIWVWLGAFAYLEPIKGSIEYKTATGETWYLSNY